MIDNAYIRELRGFLLKHNDLRDHGFVGHDGAPRYASTNETLNFFRNHPSDAYREVVTVRSRFPQRIYRPRQVSCADIANHLVTQGPRTVWIVNKANVKTLLLAGDIDDKDGHGDAQGLAEYLRDAYLGGHGYIEHSRSGIGRHVYFLLDIEFVARARVVSALIQWARLIQRDRRVEGFGSVFDRFLGLPTLWEDSEGRQIIERRGNLLKIPYLPNEEDDLQRLQNLVPLSFNLFYSAILAGKTASDCEMEIIEDCKEILTGAHRVKGDMCVTTVEGRNIEVGNGDDGVGGGDGSVKGDMCVTSPDTRKMTPSTTKPENSLGDPAKTEADDFKRKISCVDRLLREFNGTVDLNTVLDLYHREYNPTGMSEKDIQRRTVRIAKILERRRGTFLGARSQSRPFKKGEYLDLVKTLVPDTAFKWARRDLINHARLADFISIKIQDAFFTKSNGYFAAASRNATISSMKTMREKGLINWTPVPHQYTRLLEIAVEYQLLEVVDDYVMPVRDSTGKTVFKGRGRIIGPGVALPELRAEFQKRFERWKAERKSLAV